MRFSETSRFFAFEFPLSGTTVRSEISAGVYAAYLGGGGGKRLGLAADFPTAERRREEIPGLGIGVWYPLAGAALWIRGYASVRFGGPAPLAWVCRGYAQCLLEAEPYLSIGEWRCRGRARVEFGGLEGWRAQGRTRVRFGGNWECRGATEVRWAGAVAPAATWRAQGRTRVAFFGYPGTPVRCLTGDGEIEAGGGIRNWAW